MAPSVPCDNFCSLGGNGTDNQELAGRLASLNYNNVLSGRLDWDIKILAPDDSTAPLQDDDIRKYYPKTTRNGAEFNHYYINGEKSDSGIDHIKIQEALNKYKNWLFLSYQNLLLENGRI